MIVLVLFCLLLIVWPAVVDALAEQYKPSPYWEAKKISWKRLLEIDKAQ